MLEFSGKNFFMIRILLAVGYPQVYFIHFSMYAFYKMKTLECRLALYSIIFHPFVI